MVQTGLQRLLGTRVDIRRGLVENQDARVGEQHARERDELALARGQGRAALLHHGVVAVGQFHDEFVRMHGLGRGHDLLVGGVQFAVADVLTHVAGEDERVLQHDAHLPAQAFQRDGTHVVAVDRHRAFGDVVETRQQVDDRGFAGTRRTNQRDRLAWLDMQVDQVQDVAAVRLVAENHVVEVDAALDLRQIDGVRRVADLRLHIQRFEDALEIRGAGDELVVEVADADHRVPEVVRIADEGDEHTCAHLHPAEAGDADEVDERDGHDGNRLDARPHEELDVHGLHPRGTHIVLLFLERLELRGLLGEGLRGLHAGDRLVDVRVEVALLVGQHLVGATLEMLQHQHPRDEEREQREAEQCQSPVDDEHDHQRDEEREHIGDHVDQAGAQRIGQRVHIVDHTDQDLAVRARIEIAERQRLDMREDVATHVFEHELADACDLHGAVAQSQLEDHDQRREQGGQLAKQREILRRNRTVDHDLRQIRHHDRDTAHHHHNREDADHASLVRLEIDADAEDVMQVDLLLKFLILAERIAFCHDDPPF